jgi:4-hydroxy-tetrahydrodipicolinate reductase
MALKIHLNGARGRMGLAVAAAAADMGVAIVASTDVGDDIGAAMKSADVVVDFSNHGATRPLLERAVAAGRPVVIGTTGHSAAEKAVLLKLAARVPCVWAGNFSVGVNLLFSLARRAARVLGDDYAAEIVEMHHRMKKDAPSGTAIRLLEIILEERRLDRGAVRHGREGITGERPPGEVAVHSLRGGDVVGDHTVIFAGTGERLELTHRASDRAVFARGALRAAQWVGAQKPGVYDMQAVLGLD